MPQLQPGMARIRVKDLRLRTFIGINEDEILNKQDVLINLTILYAAQEAVRDNDIDHALNYRTITKAIIAHVEGNRFALLERLTQELLDLVMSNDVGAVRRSRSRQAARAALCRIGVDHPRGKPLSFKLRAASVKLTADPDPILQLEACRSKLSRRDSHD